MNRRRRHATLCFSRRVQRLLAAGAVISAAGCGQGSSAAGQDSAGAPTGAVGIGETGSTGSVPGQGVGSSATTPGGPTTGGQGSSTTSSQAPNTADSSGSTGDQSSSGPGPGSTGKGTDCKPGELYCAPGVCCSSAQECVEKTCMDPCPSKVRCGAGLAQCCDAGQVCHGLTCVDPGEACEDDVDCPVEHYCEATQGKCMPQLGAVQCEIRPKFTDVSLDYQDWAWTGGDVISIPVVADLDGDGANEVVFSTTNEKQNAELSGSIEHGNIVILSGIDGSVQTVLTQNPGKSFGSSGRSTLAVGDVDGDGAPDVIYAGRKTANSLTEKDAEGNIIYTGHESTIHAYSYKKSQYLWASHTGGKDSSASGYQEKKFVVHNGAITVANLDDDPQAEIVIGAAIIDNDGEVVWNQEERGEFFGSPRNYVGAISAVADLEPGGAPEIISGKDAWKISSWQQGVGDAPATVTVSRLWDASAATANTMVLDGYPAVADLDLDRKPEVILVGQGNLYVLDGATGKLWCGKGSCATDAERTRPYALPGSALATGDQKNYGGPATVADFDGDGRPEVGIADYLTYAVYDFNRSIKGASEVIPNAGTVPAKGAISPGGIFTRWRANTQDRSSSATGASVFDFQGDGAAEVVYADECSLHVYDGSTGSVLRQLPTSSGTIHEYPVVVDVDNDKQTEIMVVANKISNGTGQACPVTRSGVFVYGDRKERWVQTRPLWTQHTYHVTNADAQGNPPKAEVNNWDRSELNNYRQNTQGYGVFDAPDLRVKLSADLDECEQGYLKLVATVRNAGARGVPAGVEVNFFRGKNSSGQQVYFARTPGPLLPGEFTKITHRVPAKKGEVLPDHYVHVDGIGQTVGAIAECLEDNNGDVLTKAGCPAK